MKMEKIELSEEGKKRIEEIHNKVDEDFKELWEFLDKETPRGYSHKDVCGFGVNLYIIDKETKTRVYIDEWKERFE